MGLVASRRKPCWIVCTFVVVVVVCLSDDLHSKNFLRSRLLVVRNVARQVMESGERLTCTEYRCATPTTFFGGYYAAIFNGFFVVVCLGGCSL